MTAFTPRTTGRKKVFHLAGGTGHEEFTLSGYDGGDITFTGRLFSEGSFFDEEQGSNTRLRLFAVDSKRLVYSVVSGAGPEKDRRVYVLTVEDNFCHMDNGRQHFSLPMEMLLVAVFGLCGLDGGQEEGLKAALEESLRAVGA